MLTKEYLQQLKPGSYAVFQDNVLFEMIDIDMDMTDMDKQSPIYPISAVMGSDEIYDWDYYLDRINQKQNEYVIVPSKDINLHTGLTSGINNVRFQLCNK